MASPIKTRRESISAMMANPVMPSQGAAKFDFPCSKSSPSEGEPGGRPKPKKSSAVKVVTELFSTKGRKVKVATVALGSTWRRMMRVLESPSARAALTYSKLRVRRHSARTTWTSRTHENKSSTPKSTKKPGTMTEEIMIRRYSSGSEDQISMTRWKMRSVQPPK